MEEKTRHEFLKGIYEQHWLHARHVENERLWFTNIFVVVVAGLHVVIFTAGDPQLSKQFAIYIGFLILALSLIGYFQCISWRAAFIEHTTLANKILKDSRLEDYTPYISKAYRKIKIGWISAHELFLYFYAAIASGALFVALHMGITKQLQQGDVIISNYPYWWVSLISFLILILTWRGLRLPCQILWRILSPLHRFKFLQAIKQGLIKLLQKLSQKMRFVNIIWRGLQYREVEYRKDMGVQER